MAPDLEQLLIRSRGQVQSAQEPLLIEPQLAQSVMDAIGEVTEDLANKGRQPLTVVASLLRRPFANFLKSSGSDAIVLGLNELPDNRRIEVVATLGGAQALPNGNDPNDRNTS